MANVVTSVCCVVLAALVVVFAQRRGQQGGRIQYEKIGSDVTMQCGSLGDDASVTWKVNGTDVTAPQKQEGPRLILMEVDLSSDGLYSCFENPNGERRDQIVLRVGTPPKEPTVTCRSNTFPNGFYCSWHLQHPTYIPTDFEVHVKHNQKALEVQRDPVHKNRCHVKFPQLFSPFKYRVNITAVNALGKASNGISFDDYTIVKPDPPEKVVAKPIPKNVRRLEVTWNSPSTWPDVENFPLKYFLRYRPLIRDQWQHVELSDSTSHIITDAYAGKEYIIQVAAKDTEIGTWSDWSVAVHATPWIEEPKQITSTTEAEVILGLASIMKRLVSKYDHLFKMSFPGSMGWHGAPPGAFQKEDMEHWQLHAHYYPPLLRSATVRKFRVEYELQALEQRDLTPEQVILILTGSQAALRLRNLPEDHFKTRSREGGIYVEKGLPGGP